MTATESSKFLFIADDPCLDFLNTEMAADGKKVETLEKFGDLTDWLKQSSIGLPEVSAASLRRWENTTEAMKVLVQAKQLRQLLRETVLLRMGRKSVPESTISKINEILRHSNGRPVLVRKDSGFAQVWERRLDSPADVLPPLAESAAHLLAHADFSMVKKCRSRDCVLMFCDKSKNHLRNWCSMSTCGNRNKASNFYKRRRKTGAPQARITKNRG